MVEPIILKNLKINENRCFDFEFPTSIYFTVNYGDFEWRYLVYFCPQNNKPTCTSSDVPYLIPQIFHNFCFSFLLGITAVPREIENNAYANIFFLGGGGGREGEVNKVDYGKCATDVSISSTDCSGTLTFLNSGVAI